MESLERYQLLKEAVITENQRGLRLWLNFYKRRTNSELGLKYRPLTDFKKLSEYKCVSEFIKKNSLSLASQFI